MELDHRVLATLPLPGDERKKGTIQLLRAVVTRRILPFFRNRRVTDSSRIDYVDEHLTLVRMEDKTNRIRIVSTMTRADDAWTIRIHERILDFFSFVLSGDLESRLEDGTREEKKVLALAEFFLRHEIEHILYPEHKEREVIQADIDFAQDCRCNDPTFYRMLRYALSDDMNGLKGGQYLALLDEAERGLPLDSIIGTVLNTLVTLLEESPEGFLQDLFPNVDTEIKSRVMGEIYRRSRDTTYSLLQRTHALMMVLRLFALLMRKSEQEASEVFRSFMDRWGLVDLLKELNLPEATVDAETREELLNRFAAALYAHLEEPSAKRFISIPSVTPAEQLGGGTVQTKSLTERIEEARNNPAIPRQVMEVIDKNKLNAVGHSGSKFGELIETLLAIPWGKFCEICVSPAAFEEGLNRSHYGIQTPKETLCDFFSNLMWRCRRFADEQAESWQKTGSAFLLVGPPGVGKTSLAISIAQNLGIPYHKVSLGGMRDEADMRGHSFTYEGSRPGAIVQGLIRMQAMNGMFILDEADKTEKFAIATLLEILDPEQNHLFHDKYTETTVDIDLSNCHFFLTANTLDGVPPVVVNRCEVIFLDQYSIEEKVAIAREHLIKRLRSKYRITEEAISFDPEEETELLRYLIRTYTYEAGVRELERIIRTLFLRIQRKEILGEGKKTVRISRERIKEYIREPVRPRQINPQDAVGEMLALGVNVERGIGSIIPIQAALMGASATGDGTQRGFLSVVHATGNIERVMDESRKVATTGIFNCAEDLGIKSRIEHEPIHLHFMGGSTRKDGPSAGGSIALALASLLSGRKVRRDVAMTAEIDTRGRTTMVGGLSLKIETAFNAGCRTLIIPKENLFGEGGIERLPEALKEELHVLTFEEWSGTHPPFDYARHILEVVAVENIVQAAAVAFIDDSEIDALEICFESHAQEVARLIGREALQRSPVLQMVQMKTPEELDLGLLDIASQKPPYSLNLLIPSDIRNAILDRLGERQKALHLIDFDPKKQTLLHTGRRILSSARRELLSPVRLALTGPYFLIKRDGIRINDFPRTPTFTGTDIFANNYAVQGVKMKGCKSILNQVYSILAYLEPSEIDGCPFLTTLEGIHVVDLSFIPEKYRLDTTRAERILIRAMTHWLKVVKDSGLFR
jgi:ATP-dependent Lon protease